MRNWHIVLCFFVIGLLVCSCGKDRNIPVAKHVTITGSSAVSNGEAQLFSQPIIVDTRSPQEYAAGHLEGALLMPHDAIGRMIEARVPDKNTPILLYCRSGARAEMALKTLASMNYTKVENLGGMQAAAGKLKKEVVK